MFLSLSLPPFPSVFLKTYFIYFPEGKGREKERETSMWEGIPIGCLSHDPKQRPGPQPRHVSWLRIKPATFQFTGQCSTQWATPARAKWYFLKDFFCGSFIYILWLVTFPSFMDNSVGIDCGGGWGGWQWWGTGMGRGGQREKNWDYCSRITI